CSSPTDSQLLADHRPPTTLYPLSLHDALPILNARAISNVVRMSPAASGWRAIPSMARAVAKAWLIADPSAGSAIVSATAQNAIKDILRSPPYPTVDISDSAYTAGFRLCQALTRGLPPVLGPGERGATPSTLRP